MKKRISAGKIKIFIVKFELKGTKLVCRGGEKKISRTLLSIRR